ncbi:MAG: hypothetical protein JSU82_12570 [Rhodospirillales bacterium]|nr:MAG: hypothetical protein JSU82_12570 [Rhodospirillales bacterium]
MIVDIPALVDYPNHLARIHVIAEIGEDPELAANYDVVWAAMPNLAMDLVVPPLAGVLPLEIAGRVFIALTMLMLIAATAALHRVLHGRIGLWPVAVCLLLYNHLLIMGFLNYLFALGVALALFAAWIVRARWPAWLHWTVFPVSLIGLFFAHLFGLVVYGICVAAYEAPGLGQAWRGERRVAVRQAVVTAWQFLPAAMLVLLTMPEGVERDFLYGPLLAKVRALWSPTLTYLKPIDVAVFLFAAAVPLVGAMTGRLTLVRSLRLPLIVLASAAVVMPFWIQGAWGSIWYADLRLPIVLSLLLIAGLHPRNIDARLAVAILGAGAVLLGGRVADIAFEWRRMDADFAEFRTAAQRIERGAAILPVQRRNVPVPAGETRFDFAYWHVPTLAVIDRAAFVPTLFTDPAKQAVRAAPARDRMDTAFGAPIDVALLVESARGTGDDDSASAHVAIRNFWADWPRRFDYVLLTHFGARGNPLPQQLTAIHEGSYFTIYRIVGE